ncbi:class I SAM-dependent methyltransferase [Rhodopirellula bahusiensis]|uniref:SAM-dependent methyltransferase n=1 Tax=Rhodopirellula bahusiensis TaxID=2014065 RepID=A0A2G1W0V5_9BACT|nr:class I SAM-dependent methyltransferase [Rhodopirellula bahusiensis]PHQ32601.1 SAM-dependent methyltransferase [Rhodopirellula bahusiensis]
MTAAGSPLCQIVSDEELADPLRTVDAAGWLGGNISGQKVLCLAAGGGRQSCLYAAAGARVTVVDLSPAMLEQDRIAARQRGHQVELIEGSMDDLSMLPAGHFDIVIHPVSTCYVPSVMVVYAQVARVIRGGGIYISQHKSPASLQTSTQPRAASNGSPRYTVEHAYYRSGLSVKSGPNTPVPPPPANPVAARLREPGAVEFLHRWEELIGGMCRSGFVIEDMAEPMHAKRDAEPGSFAERARFVPPYVRIKARRRNELSADSPTAQRLWIPEN